MNFNVRVGDVFEDLDPRRKCRRLEVMEFDRLDGRAICRSISDKSLPGGSGYGLASRICLDRLRPISPKRGYRLVSRVDTSLAPPLLSGEIESKAAETP